MPEFISAPVGVTKAHVGLGNVDNTSDVNKPISTATQTALDGKKDYIPPVTVSWMDTFDRANATGIANVGNGWTAWNVADGDIVSNSLVRTDGGDYREFLNPATGVTLPADYTVTAVMATSGASGGRFFYGLVGRWNGTSGVRALFTTDGASLEIGDSEGYGLNNVYAGTPTLPATWTDAGDHTLALRMTGPTIELICDGVVVVSTTCSTNATLEGTGFGICGEGNGKIWRSIGASGTTGGGEPLAASSVGWPQLNSDLGPLLDQLDTGRVASYSTNAVVDADVITENGFYWWAGTAVTTALGTSDVNLFVSSQDSNYVSQIACDQFSNRTWHRQKNGASNWFPWAEIAQDALVVHKTGDETIGGNKTLSTGLLRMGGAGTGLPTVNATNAGTKLVLYGSAGATATNLAIGISSGNIFWLSTADSSGSFRFYAGAANVATISGAGALALGGPATITSENWVAATLTNAWTNYGGIYEVAGYRKMADGTVMLRGLVKTGTVALAIFTLPVGYRPAGASLWQQLANLGTCRMDVGSDGTVKVASYISPGTSALVSLSGIRFSVNG
jgi:hypothetical protein